MPGEGSANSPIGIVLGLVLLSLILLVVGLSMRRRGKLRTQGAALIWALLTIAPLFGAGAAFFLKHQVDLATGAAKAGVNTNLDHQP